MLCFCLNDKSISLLQNDREQMPLLNRTNAAIDGESESWRRRISCSSGSDVLGAKWVQNKVKKLQELIVDGLPPSEAITKMSEKYRQEAVEELHHYVR